MKYDIIYADPPWEYNGRIKSTNKRGFTHVSDHYSTMSGKEIMALAPTIKDISKENCLLFMWTTSPYMAYSIDVMKEWGFDYKAVAFVWEKERVNMGAYTMGSCEFVIVGKKGKIPKKSVHNIRQFLSEKRTKHSKKPLEIQKRIDTMFPLASKIELFARNSADGWDSWGNEIDGIDIFNGSSK